ETGAIAVDDKMMTSVPDVYSAGDCAEQYNRLTGKAAYLPLGDTANKQGKIAGANIAGGNEKFAGILGSAGFKVFDLEVARTGLSQKEIADMGIKSVDAPSMHASVAHGMPGSQKIKTILSIDISNGKLLGAQSVGAAPVGKRVDVFATALYAGLTVNQIEELDLVYAPPISPVLDSILMAATVGKKALAKA
ncbi:NADH oxidase, partial [Myxococcota bacterium]|nr:NADH oxidase [Myxococcota bacterium]